MKPIIFALATLFLLGSCAKYKEKRAWKQWYGSYTLTSEIMLFDDFHGDPVYADQMSINKYGISFTHSNGTQPSCVFSKIDNNDIPGYDYKLTFKEIRQFVLGSQGGQLASPSEETLNDNHDYYLKRVSDDKILFRIDEGGQLLSQSHCKLN